MQPVCTQFPAKWRESLYCAGGKKHDTWRGRRSHQNNYLWHNGCERRRHWCSRGNSLKTEILIKVSVWNFLGRQHCSTLFLTSCFIDSLVKRCGAWWLATGQWHTANALPQHTPPVGGLKLSHPGKTRGAMSKQLVWIKAGKKFSVVLLLSERHS